MSLKHNKLRNTGLIFELLTQNCILELQTDPTSTPPALQIVKKHFKKGTELRKELNLYQVLSEKTFSKVLSEDQCREIIRKTIEHCSVDRRKLHNELYNLCGELKNVYGLQKFFSSPVSNYKMQASINQLIEGTLSNCKDIKSIETVMMCENYLMDDIKTRKHFDLNKKNIILVENKNDEQKVVLNKVQRTLLIKKFEEKYKNMLPEQKIIMKNIFEYNVDELNKKRRELAKKLVTFKNSEKVDSVLKENLDECKKVLRKKIDTVNMKSIGQKLLYSVELIKELESL